MNEAQRRRFLASQAPWWLSTAMIFMLGIALLSVFISCLIRANNAQTVLPGGLLLPYMVWVVALGVIGGKSAAGVKS